MNARDRLMTRMYRDLGRVPSSFEEQQEIMAQADREIDGLIKLGHDHRMETQTMPVLPASMAIYTLGKVSPLDVPHVNDHVPGTPAVPTQPPPVAKTQLEATPPAGITTTSLGATVPVATPMHPAGSAPVGPAAAPAIDHTATAIPSQAMAENGLLPVVEMGPTVWPVIAFVRIWWGRILLSLLGLAMLF